MKFNAIALNGDHQIYTIDHLAPLCSILNIPLYCINESDAVLCESLYPDVNIETIALEDFSPHEMVKNYDALLTSNMWPLDSFHKVMYKEEMAFNKILRHIFCPHGFSDKLFYFKETVQEDIVLVYGQNMLDMIAQCSPEHPISHPVTVGNYRWHYYQKHKDHFNQIIQDKYLSRFEKKQPIIFYAPTWMDMEEGSTFFESCEEILDQLPSNFNILIKLHPRLELHSREDKDRVADYYQILGKYANKGNIVFIEYYPLIFPFLAASDFYLGDSSSIGYDFLAFDRPLFFLNKFRRNAQLDRNAFLYQCGTAILPEDYHNLYRIIEQSLEYDKERFSQKRQDMWTYTFDQSATPDSIRANLMQQMQRPPREITINTEESQADN